MERISVIGVPGAGKTYWIIQQVAGRVKDVAITSVTLAPIFENLKRLGLRYKINGIRTIYGLCYLALEREGLLESWKKELLKPHKNEKIKYKIAKKYHLVYSPNKFEILDKPSFNTVQSVYSKAIMNEGYFDAWEEYKDIIEIERIPKKIFEEIEDLRKKEMFYDYPFLIEETFSKDLDLLVIQKGKDSTLELRELYVDEAQDLGRIPYEILKNSEERIERFALVGDPAQSIYGFLGSDPRILLEHSTKIIKLEKTHRFGEPLSSLANKILKKMGMPYKIKPVDAKETEIKVVYGQEKTIIKILQEVKGDIIILTRTNKQARSLRRILNRVGYLAVPLENKLALLKKCIDILRLFVKFKKTKSEETLEMLLEELKEPEIGLGLESYFKKEEKKRELLSMNIPDMLEKVANLFHVNKEEILNYLKMLEKGYKRIIVDTIHAVKGLEFDIVIFYDRIPNKILFLYKSGLLDLTEELRILYTAITRVRKMLYIVKTTKSYGSWFGIY